MVDRGDQEEALERAYDARLMRRLLDYLRPYRWLALGSLVLALIGSPLDLAGPPLTKAAVDLFLAPDLSASPAGFELLMKRCADLSGFGGSKYQGIVFITLVFLLASLAAFAIHYVRWVVMETMGQRIMYDLREQVFAHLQRLSIRFYDRNPVGRLMTRLTTDVSALNELFSAGLIAVFGDLTVLFYVSFWMVRVNWRLALVSLATLPLLMLLTNWFRLGARLAFREVRARIAAVNAFLQEHLTGVQIVQLFGQEPAESARFARINQAHRRANFETSFYVSVFFPAVDVICSIGIGLAVWYGGGQVLREAASLGSLIAFIQLARAFFQPISEISDKYNILQAAMASAERIFKLLDEPPERGSPDNPVPLTSARGRIEFRNVWFAYDDEDWVLKDVSFVIAPGEKVAFVGHTGAGKTTITNLLLRLYEIQRGQILFDDVDIRDLDTRDLRSNFSIVLQDVFLFSGDINSNIRLGNEEITDEMVRSAAREVHAEDFILKLRKGYQSELMERGSGLSVGQKQLIGFARALAFDRRVLILDEATSSIDTQTELVIRDAVERLMQGRTSLVIAHRLSTIQSVDKIVVMHKGEIREEGDHQSLLTKRGLYWRLYQLQFSQTFNPANMEAVADD